MDYTKKITIFTSKIGQNIQEATQKTQTKGYAPKFASPYEKPSYYFLEGYGRLNSISPTRHHTKTCCSCFSRYPKQVEEVKSRMSTKRNGPLKVLNIGVAAGQEPLTHINSAFELSQNSSKTISDFLDLKTVDIQICPPELIPHDLEKLNPSVLNHLKNIYDSRSNKSFWGMPIENFAQKLLQANDKQDVILFNNVIQHMVPESEEVLQKTFEELADLVNPKGIICAEIESYVCENPEVMQRLELLKEILKSKNFTEISNGIFQKG